jgi:hypothetical protein
MEKEKKLLDLLDGINFKVINNKASPAEFKEKAMHNQVQYARIEARGDQYQERILDLICLVLADKLQPVMINRFGNTADYFLSRVFHEQFDTPEIQSEWRECRQLALKAISDEGLDANQMEIISKVIDNLPETIISCLVWFVGRLKVIPMQEVASISEILLRMVKEERHANNTGYN